MKNGVSMTMRQYKKRFVCQECDGMGKFFSNNYDTIEKHLDRLFEVTHKSEAEQEFERKEAHVLDEVTCWSCLGKGVR